MKGKLGYLWCKPGHQGTPVRGLGSFSSSKPRNAFQSQQSAGFRKEKSATHGATQVVTEHPVNDRNRSRCLGRHSACSRRVVVDGRSMAHRRMDSTRRWSRNSSPDLPGRHPLPSVRRLTSGHVITDFVIHQFILPGCLVSPYAMHSRSLVVAGK